MLDISELMSRACRRKVFPERSLMSSQTASGSPASIASTTAISQ
ncbi:UNVERIFIED_ORG: hypothetical protein GGD59_001938 [Rhizobium esperanzae]